MIFIASRNYKLIFRGDDMSERDDILSLYSDLRVADVRDGMDWNLLHWKGSMSPDIRPLWRTRAVGIARTARYLPYAGSIPNLTPEEYTEWQGWYYNTVCTYPNTIYISIRCAIPIINPHDKIISSIKCHCWKTLCRIRWEMNWICIN